MYTAIREYLEIPQRAQILNDRLRVISDLLSMLRDHLTNFGVEYQTLIIIYLIIIAVIVACVSYISSYLNKLVLTTLHFYFSLKLALKSYNHLKSYRSRKIINHVHNTTIQPRREGFFYLLYTKLY